jgi:hypothetical protein
MQFNMLGARSVLMTATNKKKMQLVDERCNSKNVEVMGVLSLPLQQKMLACVGQLCTYKRSSKCPHKFENSK